MDLIVIDDDKLIRTAAMQMAEDAGHYAEAAADRASALRILSESRFDLVLLDLQLGQDSGLDLLPEILRRHPGTPVVMVTGNASIPAAVEAMRLGALDFMEKPFTPELLGITLQKAARFRRLAQQVESLKEEAAQHQPSTRLDSSAPSMQSALDILFRSADTDASILILGDSGTGKTMIAREVHGRSRRAAKPFITINCPSLGRELIESELFGHVKGAFTGAIRDSRGKVSAADGGTLFLDEVGDLPQEVQARLLRLLNDREYERVGDATVRRADVRIIAATNRDLAGAVASGEFREDLYFRLNVISVTLPPLRERRSDVPALSEAFLQFFARQYGRPAKTFSMEALQLIENHGWPGNLRELRNAIERAVILCTGRTIQPADLPGSLSRADALSPVEKRAEGTLRAGDPCTLDALTAAHILKTIERSHTLAEAARILGIDEATLYRRRKKLAIPPRS
jgi:NtrC-family two-component system response regulator AlgB